MAEEEKEGTEKEAATAAPAADPKAKKKKMLIIGAASVVGLLLLITIIYFVFFNGSTLDSDAASKDSKEASLVEEGADEEEEFAENEAALGAMFPLETFVVNLAGGGFIKAQIQLEFTSKSVPKRFMNKLVPLRDLLIALLASKSRSDLLNKEGKEDLKAEIITIVNDTLGKQEVRNVYFTNFVIQ